MKIMKKIKSIAVITILITLSACAEDEPTRLTNVSGLIPDLSFELIDEDNKVVRASDYHGYTVALFFGFTNCPGICPTTMHQLSQVLADVDPEGSSMKVLFVSVDPKRDTVEKLKKYTDIFGPAFIGLRGDESAVKEMTKKYRVTFGYGDSDAQGNYEVSHSGAVFVFDSKGEAKLLATQSSTTEDMIYDVKKLVNL
tara:strand:- start:1794 stop:2384 length:591 start_codon:yes stop_codon:yes gene_type:complete